MEIDFGELNRRLATAAECAVANCTNRVPASDGMCQACFMGNLEGTTVWDPEIKRYITTREG